MRVLVLHSDVPSDAPPDEQDTLYQADSIVEALEARGHQVERAAFTRDESVLTELFGRNDAVFNLVESIDGSGALAVEVPEIFRRLGARHTGATRAALKVTGEKPLAKRRLRNVGLPTPDWSEPPRWDGLCEDVRYIVKSTLEDASFGLDDNSIVRGGDNVKARAEICQADFGGGWFAEAYVEGREFNVAVLEDEGGPLVLPLAEMTFQEWQPGRPRIVGYKAKWDDDSFESTRTVRAFGVDEADPKLAAEIRELASHAWGLFSLTGYARVDFRVDEAGRPTILELNPNPCLSPDAGFAAAAAKAGMPYDVLIDRILQAAVR